MNRSVARLRACLLAAAIALPLTSFAAAVPDIVKTTDRGYERDWAKALLMDDQRAEKGLAKALASESKRPKALAALQRLAQRDAFIGITPEAEARLRQLVLPDYDDRFDRQITFEGRQVVQDTALIDAERAPWSKVDYSRTVKTKSTEQVGLPVHLSAPPTPMRNAARMKNGQAPFGPDNRQVLLCRLLDDDRAAYYEVREGEVEGLLARVGNTNRSDACLGADEVKTYWQSRYDDFVNARGVHLFGGN